MAVAVLPARAAFISAYDAGTGQPRWRFNTVAGSDEPDGNTWANLPDVLRGGGETWITGSYDPELNLVYFGWRRRNLGWPGAGG